jgi:hypothetical protein
MARSLSRTSSAASVECGAESLRLTWRTPRVALYRIVHHPASSTTTQASEDTNKQLFFNNHAKMAVQCLARLGGYLTGVLASPKNPAIQAACDAMLTPYLAGEPFHLPP